MKQDALRLQKVIYILQIKSKVVNENENETKRSLPFSLDTIISSTAGFEKTDSFTFQELIFALICLFYNNGTLAS